MSEYQSREALELRTLLHRFGAWLEEAGVVTQQPVGDYEVIRFRAIPAAQADVQMTVTKSSEPAKPIKAPVHVVYRSKTGAVTWTGDARTYWGWFRAGRACPAQPPIKVPKKARSQTQRTREKLIERDGTDCHFCGKTMRGHDHEGRPTKDGRDDMTIEHLIGQHFARTEGLEVNHLENLVLAHAFCNRQIGHRPMSEKITYREIMHNQRTTMWDTHEITARPRTRPCNGVQNKSSD